MGFEIDLKCDTLYGFILEPYAWIVFSTVAFQFLQYVFEEILEPKYLQPWLRYLKEIGCNCCGILEYCVSKKGTERETIVLETVEMRASEAVRGGFGAGRALKPAITIKPKVAGSSSVSSPPLPIAVQANQDAAPSSTAIVAMEVATAEAATAEAATTSSANKSPATRRDTIPPPAYPAATPLPPPQPVAPAPAAPAITAADSDLEAAETITSPPSPTMVQVEVAKKKKVANKDEYPMFFFYMQFFYTLATFGFMCATYDHGPNKWQSYTNFIGLMSNSCVLTTLVSGMKKMEEIGSILRGYYDKDYEPSANDSKEEEKAKKVRKEFVERYEKKTVAAAREPLEVMTYVCFYLVLPGVITHVIPAMVLYCWVAAAFYIGCFFFLFCFYGWFRCVTFCSMTLMNYATIFYTLPVGHITPQQYIGVIVEEYWLRSETTCFLQEHLDVYRQMVPFLSWI